jgi:hypothetical protein
MPLPAAMVAPAAAPLPAGPRLARHRPGSSDTLVKVWVDEVAR